MPPNPSLLPTTPLSLLWHSEQDTARLAAALAGHPGIAEAHLNLSGDLGAGKTTFVRHLLSRLGVVGRIKSPTYAIVEPHEGLCQGAPLDIAHFDFYRFDAPEEWEDAGFRDAFAQSGLKLVEWPQRARDLMPPADLELHITWQAGTSETRCVTLTAHTLRGLDLLKSVSDA